MTKRTVLQSRSFIGAAAKLACLMLFAGAAQADPVYLTLDGGLSSPNYVSYTFTAADGSSQSNYVAPYPTYISSTAGVRGRAAFSICLDINNPTDVGQQYSGNWATPIDHASLETTFLANLLNLEGNKSAPLAVQGAISYAIWDIMYLSSNDSEHLGGFVHDPAATAYEAWANQMVTGGRWTVLDSSLYPIFMPTDTTSQRFAVIFTDTTPVNVPEPGELTLLSADLLSCSGLLVLAVLWRRRVGHSE
jgi:hypothetical protein